MELTKQQIRLLRQLEKKEKEIRKEGYENPFTDNRQPLADLIKQTEWRDTYSQICRGDATDNYWHWWKIFYLRIDWLVDTTNKRVWILDIMDAPLYLEQEMNNHDYLHKYN